MNCSNIGLDVHGVIVSPVKTRMLKTRAAIKLFGKRIPPANFSKEKLLRAGILTEGQHQEIRSLVYGTSRFVNLMSPAFGACDYLPELRKRHLLYGITAATGVMLELLQGWLQQRHISIPLLGVGYMADKTEILISLELDVYVDDKLENLLRLAVACEHHNISMPRLLLFSWAGYNTDYQAPSPIERVYSWRQLNEEVRKLEACRLQKQVGVLIES